MQAEPTLGRKILFTLIVDLALLLLLEGLLAVIGVRPLLWDEDPFVGFSSQLPLFEPQRTASGESRLVTANNKLDFFNRQSFPESKAPETFRIFCLGGSTTFGRPFDHPTSFCGWLEELLPRVDPSHRWEVINAGGISYASYRVARLMEELADYEPDLFLVYSGHNEFLERRTYQKLIEMPAGLRELRRLLSRTRIFTVLQRGFDRLRRRERTVLAGEVDTILDNSVGPAAYSRDDELRQQVVEHYRLNIGRMADIAAAAGAQIVFVTPASNLLDSAPFKSQHGPELDEAGIRRWLELSRQAEEDPTLALFDELASLDPRHAGAHYQRGRALAELGRYSEAREALIRARDEDVCPLRALSELDEVLREETAHLALPLVDFRSLVEENSEHRLPGADLFLDHVHPTRGGHRLLGVELVRVLAELGVVEPSPGWEQSAVEEAELRIDAGVDRGKQAAALANLAKVLAWAGQHDEGRRLAHQALALDPENLDALYFAAHGAVQAGEHREAEQLFERLVQRAPNRAHAWNGLGVAVLRQRRPAEALAHFDRALGVDSDLAAALFNRAQAMEELGRSEEARAGYRRVLELDPQHVAASFQLGSLLLREGSAERAIPLLRVAVGGAPDRPELHHRLGVAYSEVDRLEDAERHFRTVVRLDPRSAAAHGDLGRLLARRGRLEEASKALASAVELEPDRAGRHRQLAQVLLDLDRRVAAAEQLEIALALDPENDAARDLLDTLRP